jgi:hypothetical protein
MDRQDNTVLKSAAAEIATAQASKYLQQLCKHFAHKRPTVFDTESGHIGFQSGDVSLKAKPGVLAITVMAPDDAQLAQLKDVVVRHLERFAFRETLQIAWEPQI